MSSPVSSAAGCGVESAEKNQQAGNTSTHREARTKQTVIPFDLSYSVSVSPSRPGSLFSVTILGIKEVVRRGRWPARASELLLCSLAAKMSHKRDKYMSPQSLFSWTTLWDHDSLSFSEKILFSVHKFKKMTPIKTPLVSWTDEEPSQSQTTWRQKVKIFSSVSGQHADPVPLKGAALWLANTAERTVSPAVGCFVIPCALIQVRRGQLGVNRKGLQLIDLEGSRNIDLTTLLWTTLDVMMMTMFFFRFLEPQDDLCCDFLFLYIHVNVIQ